MRTIINGSTAIMRKEFIGKSVEAIGLRKTIIEQSYSKVYYSQKNPEAKN